MTSKNDTVNVNQELTELNRELDNLTKLTKKNLSLVKNYGNSKPNKSSKNKDPNHPKRSRSAYIIFCNANRSKVQKSNPELGAKDITRKLAEMWKALPEKKRGPFDKEAAQDKVRYEKEMAEYNKSS